MSAAAPDHGRQTVAGTSDTRPTHGRPVGKLVGLDGIRGAGMIIVLLYHNNFPWIPGGVLTVSMFFTLSGYLITRLLIAERERTGRISLRRFWDRRVRRLMPAAAVVICATAILSWLFPSGRRPLSFGDVFSASTYWENLHLIRAGSNYAEVNGVSSPLIHMWSLSLEEQIYLLFPLTLIALLAVRSVRARAGTLLAAGAVAGFALGPWLQHRHGTSVAYYATPVRAAEFLVGAALACWWAHSRHVETLLAVLRHPATQVASLGLFGVELWLWWNVGLVTPWVFPWGLAANSVLVAAIMCLSEAGGVVERILSFSPFVWLGVRVYGIYLVHWPVFRFFSPEATGLGLWPLFAVRVAVTLVIAEAIYRLLEDPVRNKRRWRGATVYVACAAILAVACVAGFLGRHTTPDRLLDIDYIRLQRENLLGTPQVPADAPSRSASDPNLPARVLFVGDSQSFSVGHGMQPWGEAHGVEVRFNPGVGCGIGGVTPIRYLGVEKTAQEGCAEWAATRPQIFQRFRPNLVVVTGGLGDLSDRLVEGQWRHIGDPVYDIWLARHLRAFVDEAASGGGRVLWLSMPTANVRYQQGATGQPPFAENSAERTARYNALVRATVGADARVTIVDFAAAVEALPDHGFDPKIRPDGAHIDMAAAPTLVSFVAQAVADATR